VLRHFPLITRLQRIFSTTKSSNEAQWHKLYRKPKEGQDLGEMSHSADGEAWEDFDKNWPYFPADARNIRFGLATDGINPYNNMGKRYIMWHVFVIPYNFAPWGCIE
jgi:hypothetical protein